MERLKLVIRKHTATDLADFFGVPQSAVSAAVRRGKMPSSWLVILMRVKKVHPEWILTGKGPCLMTLRPEPSRYETDVEVTTRKADEEALRRLPSHMLAEELVRRIAVSQGHAFCSECLGNQSWCSALYRIRCPNKKGRQSPTGLFPINGTH